MFKWVVNSLKGGAISSARVPDGSRVYVIGDIHGRIDLLKSVDRLIRGDMAKASDNNSTTVVYLGDYVDRGLQSREVLDFLIDKPIPGCETVYLMGNHEQAFLGFLEDEDWGSGWFKIGGDVTAFSYGVRVPQDVPPDQLFSKIQEALLAAVPQHHLDFLANLRLTHQIGDYLFVHAGIRPGVSLDRQSPDDLLWIKQEFLESEEDFGKIVVHGHTVTDAPEIRTNRIGIDTGAYFSQVLTCLVLEGVSKRFLST